MKTQISSIILQLILCSVINVLHGQIELNPNGVSQIAPISEDMNGWFEVDGSEHHQGDDFHAQDWNYGDLNGDGNLDSGLSPDNDCGLVLKAGISGTVVFVKDDCIPYPTVNNGCGSGFGNRVIIRSDVDPSFALFYSHLESASVVENSYVNIGDEIGRLGSTGQGYDADPNDNIPPTSFPCHLHLVLYKNITNQNHINNLQAGFSPSVDYSGEATSHAAEFTISLTETLPDITIQSQTVETTILEPEEWTLVQCEQHIVNSTENHFVWIRYFLSDNQTYEPNADIQLGEDYSTIGINDPFDLETAVLTIPPGTEGGTKYILFVADHVPDNNSNGLVEEENEDNNVESIEVTILDGNNSPNIFPSSPILSHTSAQVGQFVNVSFWHNINPSPANPILSHVGYYYSHDNVWDSSDVWRTGDYSIFTPNKNTEYEYAYFSIPPQALTGDRFIIIKVDDEENHMESNEDDNYYVFPIQIVSGNSNLIAPPNNEVSPHNTLQSIGDNFSVTPNPTKDHITIQYEPSIEMKNSTVSLYDLQGRVVLEQSLEMNNTSTTLDVSTFPKGIYIISITNGQESFSEKISIID